MFILLLSSSETNSIFFQDVSLNETIISFQNFLQQNLDYNVKLFNSLEEIFSNYLSNINKPQTKRVVICGSLYLYRDLAEII